MNENKKQFYVQVLYTTLKSTKNLLSNFGLSGSVLRSFSCTYLGIEYQEGLRIEDVGQPNILVLLLPGFYSTIMNHGESILMN